MKERGEPNRPDLEPGENGGESKLLRFVANGRPIPGHEVRIVDEENLDVAERVRGRVLFRGPSKTSGYYRNPEATSAVTTDGGWMDTGDLGYWADGELYITGRLKETIIKGGHNITPQEIELAAADVAGVRRGCVAAFGVTDRDSGTEKLIVVAETRSGARGEFGRIREEIVGAVDERVGTPPDHVELVAPPDDSQDIKRQDSPATRRGCFMNKGGSGSRTVRLGCRWRTYGQGTPAPRWGCSPGKRGRARDGRRGDSLS